jgi:hypothetical protein
LIIAVVVVLACASPAFAQPVSGSDNSERVSALASVGWLLNSIGRQRTSGDDAERVAAAADLSVLVDAVAPATPGVAARDTIAYRLLALGYSPRETADVVSGRISRRARAERRQAGPADRGPSKETRA